MFKHGREVKKANTDCVGGYTFSVYSRHVAPVVSLDNVYHSSCLLGI